MTSSLRSSRVVWQTSTAITVAVLGAAILGLPAVVRAGACLSPTTKPCWCPDNSQCNPRCIAEGNGGGPVAANNAANQVAGDSGCGGGTCAAGSAKWCKGECPNEGSCHGPEKENCGDCKEGSESKSDSGNGCNTPGVMCMNPKPGDGKGCGAAICKTVAGVFNASAGSIQFSFSMGLLPGGVPAPRLWVHSDWPTPALSTPTRDYLHVDPAKRLYRWWDHWQEIPELRVLSSSSGIWDYARNDYGVDSLYGSMMRQIITPETFVDVHVTNPYRYELTFYSAAGCDAWPHGYDPNGGEDGNGGDGIYYIPQGTPYAVYVVENPDGETSYNRLNITQYSGDNTRIAQYEYTFSEGDFSWTLVIRDGSLNEIRSEKTTRVLDTINRQTLLTYAVREQGGLIYETSSTNAWFQNAELSGQRELQKTMGPTGNPMQLQRTFWLPSGSCQFYDPEFCPEGLPYDRFWNLQSLLTPSGLWFLRDYERYSLTDAGFRTTVEVRPWKDQAKPALEPNADLTALTTGYSKTLYDYTPHTTPNNDDVGPQLYNDYADAYNYVLRPRTITEQVGATTVRKTFHVYRNLGPTEPVRQFVNAAEEHIEELAADVADSAPGDAANLKTITEYYPCETYTETQWDDTIRTWYIPAAVKSITYPDGRKDTCQRTRGVFTPGTVNAQASPPTFSAGSFEPMLNPSSIKNLDVRIVITHGSVDYPGGTSGETTVEVIVEDYVGRKLLHQIYANPCSVGENGALACTDRLMSWTEWQYDARGRVKYTLHSNGTMSSNVWEDCCSRLTATDETGVQTVTEFDPLGRPKTVTKKGVTGGTGATQDIVTEYTRTAATGGGYLETTQTYPADHSIAALTTQTQYDTAGRLTRTVDSAGLVTQYSETIGTGGGKCVTVTRPDGSTEITDYYRDGRIKSISGTGVVAKDYDYWVDAEGLRWTRVRTAGTWPITDTAINCLDQTVKVIDQTGARTEDTTTKTYHYNTKGQLLRVETATPAGKLMADMLYEYNHMGEVTKTGLDVNASGSLETTGSSGQADRIEESQSQYTTDQGNWWAVSAQKTYTTDAGGYITRTTKQQLSGWTGGLIEQTASTDGDGSPQATEWAVLDWANKQVTRYSQRPDGTTGSSVMKNGLLQSSTVRPGVTTEYAYDALGRQLGAQDPRTGTWTETHYNSVGQVDWTKDTAGKQTSYEYYSDGQTGAGRLRVTTDPLGKKQYFSYTSRGQLQRTWGNAVTPAMYGYDSRGEQGLIYTFRGGEGWDGPDWPSNIGTPGMSNTVREGWRTRRIINGQTVIYLFRPDGKLLTRTWSRTSGGNPLVTTYAYDPNTGDLTSITYSDGTPSVVFTYDRAGRQQTVTDIVGERTFGYSSIDGQPESETIVPGTGGLYALSLSRSYDTYRRPSGFSIASAGYSVGYGYDATTGRLSRVTGPGLPGSPAQGGAIYTPAASSDMVSMLEYKSEAGATLASAERHYLANRNLVDYVENRTSPSPADPVSRYAYVNDDVGRRTSVLNSGTAFTQSAFSLWRYNSRSELTESVRGIGTAVEDPPTNPVPAEYRLFAYDNIGNRTESQTGGPNPPSLYYSRNTSNQYCDTNLTAAYETCGTAQNPVETFAYDTDGNLTQNGAYTYTWDGENRLVAVAPVSQPVEGSKQLTFSYDYMSRRVRKQVWTWATDNWQLTTDSRFVYDQWNVIMVLSGTSNTVVSKYTWGLDLSGLSGDASTSGIHGAGGIGGLLAVEEPQAVGDPKRYWFFYDANGNVGQMVRADNQAIAARYEYDAYGNKLVAADGQYDPGLAEANPFRFSTKWLDGELGDYSMYYYGYRYYLPRIGRWGSRDPAGEAGSMQLYLFLRNEPTRRHDPLGLKCSVGGTSSTAPYYEFCRRPAFCMDRVKACVDCNYCPCGNEWRVYAKHNCTACTQFTAPGLPAPPTCPTPPKPPPSKCCFFVAHLTKASCEACCDALMTSGPVKNFGDLGNELYKHCLLKCSEFP